MSKLIVKWAIGSMQIAALLAGAYSIIQMDQAAMDNCLGRLSACRSGSERAWLHEVGSCLSVASSVSDRCLAALINPVTPRP